MANSEWRATEGPVALICENCGSHDVWGTARVTWDDMEGRWAVEGDVTGMVCNHCDRSVGIHEVQITGLRDIPTFIRSKRNTEGAA